jgi:hypothetical protein
MNQTQIKYLAALLMLADHVGFLINSEPLRMLGRLSYPLFAWVFAQNWKREGDKKKLITRLILFGVISQIPYILLFNKLTLNIMFSFAATAITFSYIRKYNRKIPILIISLISTQLLNIDYGWYAIATPLLLLNLKGKGDRVWWISWVIVNIVYAINTVNGIQLFAVLTPVILRFHNPNKDVKPTEIEKRFFYYFYPIHIASLAAIGTSMHLLTYPPAIPVTNSKITVTASQSQILPVSAKTKIGNSWIELEVATTPKEQATGLMYRTSLGDNRGMLFKFESAQKVKFWMKNCKISLDMIFLRNGAVTAIQPATPPCTADPCPTYGPDTMVDQIIELRGGRAAELNLKVGDRVTIKFIQK